MKRDDRSLRYAKTQTFSYVDNATLHNYKAGWPGISSHVHWKRGKEINKLEPLKPQGEQQHLSWSTYFDPLLICRGTKKAQAKSVWTLFITKMYSCLIKIHLQVSRKQIDLKNLNFMCNLCNTTVFPMEPSLFYTLLLLLLFAYILFNNFMPSWPLEIH